MSVDAVAPQDEGAQPTSREPGWFYRVIWLGPRVAEARANAFRPRRPGFDLYDVARELHDEAARIRRAGRSPWAVLMLDCIAVEWLVRAHLALAGRWSGTDPLGDDDWAAVQHLPGMESVWNKFSSTHLPTLMAALGMDRLAALAKLSNEDRESFAVNLHQLVQDLIEPLEVGANLLGWALFARWSRIALAGALLVIMLAWGAKWVNSKASPNLALHRAVSASSLNGYGPDAARLVDGITDELAFHTNGGDQQWVVIDLGEVKTFDKVVVYNRPDCCGERAVPLKVEVSNDNHNFRQIAERIPVFDKWTAKNLHAEGRYVRLKNTPPNFFHLAEVEIY